MNVKEIFKYAVTNGLVDLVEYIYVWHNIEYELDELTNQIQERIESITDNLYVTNVYDHSANSGLNLQYMNIDDINLQKSIKKLYSLRKYSIMKSKNKKFYYKFNIKKRHIFCQSLVN